MSRRTRPLGWLVVLVAFGVTAASSLPAGQPEQGKGPAGKAPTTRPPGGIIVSRETTFLTGPLRKDGTVDYVAAIDERYSQGVTPENNAVVLLLQALGPGEIDAPMRPAFFKKLGVPPLPEKGPYLEAFWKYYERKGLAAEAPKDGQQPDVAEKTRKLEQIMYQPWSKKDSPIGATWLEENQKRIDLIVAATKRSRFYAPLLAGRDEPGTAIAVLLPVAQHSREAARALSARAMFRIAAGKPEEAWQDLLACHRLARLVDQATTLVDGLVAIAIEGIAIQGDAALAHEGKLTPAHAARFAAEFRKLPPLSKMADRINWSERLMYLDCVLAVACKGIGEITKLSDGSSVPNGGILAGRAAIAIEGIAVSGDAAPARKGRLTAEEARRFAAGFGKVPVVSKMVDRMNWLERLMCLDCVPAVACRGFGGFVCLVDGSSPPKGSFASFAERFATAMVDWNEPMRMGNQWYDRLVAALSKPSHKERDAAIAEFERDLKEAAAGVKDVRVLLRNIAFAGSLRGGLGRQMGHIFIALLMPALSACVNAEDRNATLDDMVPVVFALAAYRADHGAYPADLATLVPKYLPAAPEDPFSSGPLRYKREGAGFLLYSVGRNGKDDGGRAYWDEPGSEQNLDHDDIAIRVPAKKK